VRLSEALRGEMMRDFSLWRWFSFGNFTRGAEEKQKKRRSPGKVSQTKADQI
jgi:hypothetical protein